MYMYSRHDRGSLFTVQCAHTSKHPKRKRKLAMEIKTRQTYVKLCAGAAGQTNKIRLQFAWLIFISSLIISYFINTQFTNIHRNNNRVWGKKRNFSWFKIPVDILNTYCYSLFCGFIFLSHPTAHAPAIVSGLHSSVVLFHAQIAKTHKTQHSTLFWANKRFDP